MPNSLNALAVSAVLVLVPACNPKSPAQEKVMKPAPAVSQDVELLAKIIQLPERPASAKWLLTTRGDGFLGPQDESITLVLNYSPEVADRLLATCPPAPGEDPNPPLPFETWFPKTVQPWVTSDGKSLRLPGPRRLPAPFFKSPFLNGSVARIPQTGTLLVHLFTI